MSCDDGYYVDEEKEQREHREYLEFKKKIMKQLKESGKDESGVLFSMLYDLCLEWEKDGSRYIDTFIHLHRKQISKLENYREKKDANNVNRRRQYE
jgi:hypothetical protein